MRIWAIEEIAGVVAGTSGTIAYFFVCFSGFGVVDSKTNSSSLSNFSLSSWALLAIFSTYCASFLVISFGFSIARTLPIYLFAIGNALLIYSA
jgi:hypothetical protein